MARFCRVALPWGWVCPLARAGLWQLLAGDRQTGTARQGQGRAGLGETSEPTQCHPCPGRVTPPVPGTVSPVPGCPNVQPGLEHLCLCKRSRNSPRRNSPGQTLSLRSSSPHLHRGSSPAPSSPAQPLNPLGTNGICTPNTPNIPNSPLSSSCLGFVRGPALRGARRFYKSVSLYCLKGTKNRFSHLFLLNKINQAQLTAPK